MKNVLRMKTRNDVLDVVADLTQKINEIEFVAVIYKKKDEDGLFRSYGVASGVWFDELIGALEHTKHRLMIMADEYSSSAGH